MTAPVTFQRLYLDHGPGEIHPATPRACAAVIKSMNAATLAPFKVRFVLDDGSSVVVRQKRSPSRPSTPQGQAA